MRKSVFKHGNVGDGKAQERKLDKRIGHFI